MLVIVEGLESQAEECRLDVGIKKPLKGFNEKKGQRFASYMDRLKGQMSVRQPSQKSAAPVA